MSDLGAEMEEVMAVGWCSISALQAGSFPWGAMARNMQPWGKGLTNITTEGNRGHHPYPAAPAGHGDRPDGLRRRPAEE